VFDMGDSIAERPGKRQSAVLWPVWLRRQRPVSTVIVGAMSVAFVGARALPGLIAASGTRPPMSHRMTQVQIDMRCPRSNDGAV
jgi:hypothetical protein